jgi:hypothetical protein
MNTHPTNRMAALLATAMTSLFLFAIAPNFSMLIAQIAVRFMTIKMSFRSIFLVI